MTRVGRGVFSKNDVIGNNSPLPVGWASQGQIHGFAKNAVK